MIMIIIIIIIKLAALKRRPTSETTRAIAAQISAGANQLYFATN